MSNFQPLVVVDRGSETQPQVVENNGKQRIILIIVCNVFIIIYI